MYTYQHITNRNEFIQEFRKNQGLDISRNTNPKSAKSRKTNNNPKTNISTSSISNNDGRWNYLHQLEKLRKVKLNEQRNLKEQLSYEKDFQECTFSPKLNKSKRSTTNLSEGLSGISGGNNNNNNMSNLNNSTNKIQLSSNSNIQSYNGKDYDPLIERQKMWEYKKNMKIENIKHDQNMRDTEECIFNPVLVRIFLIL